ncbi:hypothetical protein LBMAG53_27060 [Planctomycetota bacterium]|nr:hypothetical protein LBMAG53_27060 [Planctomycetota bacterium]
MGSLADGTKLAHRQTDFQSEARRNPNPLTAISAAPPITIQIDLSVGEPVKNLETLEENESIAMRPKTTKAIPAMSRIKERALFTR